MAMYQSIGKNEGTRIGTKNNDHFCKRASGELAPLFCLSDTIAPRVCVSTVSRARKGRLGLQGSLKAKGLRMDNMH